MGTTDHPVSTHSTGAAARENLNGVKNTVSFDDGSAKTGSDSAANSVLDNSAVRSDNRDHAKDLANLKEITATKPEATENRNDDVGHEEDLEDVDPDAGGGSTSLVVGVVFGLILLSVVLFVGFKRL